MFNTINKRINRALKYTILLSSLLQACAHQNSNAFISKAGSNELKKDQAAAVALGNNKKKVEELMAVLSPKNIKELKIHYNNADKWLGHFCRSIDATITGQEDRFLGEHWSGESGLKAGYLFQLSLYLETLQKVYSALREIEQQGLKNISLAIKDDIQSTQALSDDMFSHQINESMGTVQIQLKRKSYPKELKRSLLEIRQFLRELHKLFAKSEYAFPLTQNALLDAITNLGGIIEKIK